MKAILDLKHKRTGLLDQAQSALDKKDMVEYKRLMDEVESVNNEIDALEKLEAERGRFSEDDPHMMGVGQAVQQEKEQEQLRNNLDEARRGNDYVNAWSYAMKNCLSPKTGLGNEKVKPLFNALTITGGAPVGSDGGFLVPVDFDNMLTRKLKEFIRLSDYFKLEEVSTYSGWRAIETTASRPVLPQIEEGATIPRTAQPKFKRIDYTIKKYGDRIPVSSELLDDNSVGLMEYLVEWFTPRVVMTENSLLLALLDDLTPTTLTASKEVAGLKKALNKDLNTAISKNAILLVNQDSYDFLDQALDANGRALLVPNPADPDVYRFKSRRVIMADTDLLPNRTEGADEMWPIYIGYMKAFGTLFRRKALEFATTTVGGDAWETDSTEVRGIVRMDAQTTDEKAAIKREIKAS